MLSKKNLKYIKDAIWPINKYGCSTGFLPIHVKIKNIIINIQNNNWFNGKNIFDLILLYIVNGIIIKIKIDINNAITPPNLLGIERKIA